MTAAKLQSLRDAAGPVSRETFERLEQFESAFLKWNERINLVAASTLDELWTRHILDSAQLLRLAPHASRWLDLGSGGGFPGLVIAFLLADLSQGEIALVESNRKKAGFLQAMTAQFGLPARVYSKRIDGLYEVLDQPEVVTARALAPLSSLLDLTSPWLTAGGTGLFHKGRDYRNEVQESAHSWDFDLVEHRSRIGPHGVILEIANLRRKDRPGR